MNWLFIVVSIAFLIGMIVGIARGAVKIAVSLLVTAATIALVFFATPYVSQLITSMTPAQSIVESHIASTVNRMLDAQEEGSGAEGQQEAAAEAVPGEGASAAEGSGTQEMSRDMQILTIERAKLPRVLKDMLLANNNSDIYSRLGVDNFVSYVSAYLASIILNMLTFLMTLIVATIIIRAIIFSLNVIADLPVFGIANRIAGGFLGMGSVLVVVWVVFVFIALLYTIGVGTTLYDMIRSDTILSIINEYNPIMKLATTIR